MSNTVAINIRTNANLKAQAQRVAADLGFSLSSLINGYLKQLTRTKTIFFRASNEEPSNYLIQALKESEADRKAGRYYSFDNTDEAVAFLDKIIDKKPK